MKNDVNDELRIKIIDILMWLISIALVIVVFVALIYAYVIDPL